MNNQVAAWLGDIRFADETLYGIVEYLRTMILGLDGTMCEEVKYGGLLFGGAQAFCGVFVYRAHVSLEFGEGASLSDPHKILEGKGKFRRHVKFRHLADIETKCVAEILRQAWQQAMIQ